MKPLVVALLCGGPSPERGISLNSARSVVDHLHREGVDIRPIYVDSFKNFYLLSTSQLYSNTPSDFDFKLSLSAKKLSEEDLLAILKTVDIVFPVIHGCFGEDGELQAFLERHHIPFVGSPSTTCQRMFDKHTAASRLHRHGYPTLPTIVLQRKSSSLLASITNFFHRHSLSRVVVKPIAGGSSIGVSSAYSPQEAVEKAQKLFSTFGIDEALVEPFCSGREFTVIIMQALDGTPVALIPTEIQVSYENGGLFDYRRKYLPTTNTHWYCPPRFSEEQIASIRNQAEDLFRIFQMRDFARIDGWILDDGTILFSDFNPISGLEQNSFIFQQASRIGMTHADLLWHILSVALHRYNKTLPAAQSAANDTQKDVFVLFGGATAERQVSLMSGTNVWLKLRSSKKYRPHPFLLDIDHNVWRLPYTYALNHTVEEIHENCLHAASAHERLKPLVEEIRNRLQISTQATEYPQRLSFEEFIEQAKLDKAFIFLGLHGGDGENGVIQGKLEQEGLSYNGSGPKGSSLCMDKYATGQAIHAMNDPTILTVPKKKISLSSFSTFTHDDCVQYWEHLQKELQDSSFIIKPQKDGCSAGIVRLFTPEDLWKYCQLVFQKAPSIPPFTFTNQTQPIEMPFIYEDDYLLERFIETDHIRIVQNTLVHQKKSGWIELTVGVLEKNGAYSCLNPSITVAEGEVLSVEEKFQGGTGVNITPPSLIDAQGLHILKSNIEKIALALSIRNYARIDIFFNIDSFLMYVIEANTLPALTPSTVLYQQALSETPPLFPRAFLEQLIDGAYEHANSH